MKIKKKDMRKDNCNIKIRKAIMSDIDSNLLNLYIDGYNIHQKNRCDIFLKKSDKELKDNLINVLNRDDKTYLVLTLNNDISGYISYKLKNNSIWIDELVIDKNKRGLGYGKMLIGEIKKIAKNNDIKRVELNCWKFNEKGVEFYKKLDFKEQRIIFEIDV